MTIIAKLKEILPDADSCLLVSNSRKILGFTLELESGGRGIDISFSQLIKLSKLFETEEIDVNNYGLDEGCSTCGYGSRASVSIQVYNPKINYADLLKEIKSHNRLW